jgi:hypothetical protein
MIASIVDTGDLVEVVWVSLVAGVGLTAVYGIAIFGGTRAMDLSRAGRSVQAALYGALGGVAFVTVLAAMVLGIVVMADK